MLRATGLISIVAAALFATTASADDHWQVRAFGAFGQAGDGFGLVEGADRLEVDAGDLEGWGLAIDYRFTPRLGVSAGWLDADVDTRADVRIGPASDQDRFDLGTQVLSLALDVDLLPRSRVDLNLSPAVAWIDYANPDLDLTNVGPVTRLDLDDEVSWGLGLRADVPFGRFLVTGGVTYFDATAEVTNPEIEPEIDIELDPFVWSLGVGYRF
jgi:hypothetical protein